LKEDDLKTKEQIRQSMMRDERSRKAQAGYLVRGVEYCPRKSCDGTLTREPDGWGRCSECGLRDWYPPPKVMDFLRTRT
jgi:hypothetical protein